MQYLLDELRRRPPRIEVWNRVMLLLDHLPKAALAQNRRLPAWIGDNLFAETIDTAFATALASLPDDVAVDDVSEYVENEIERAVTDLLRREPGQCAARRDHSIPTATFDTRGKRMDAVDDSTIGDSLRDAAERNEEEFLACIEAARSRPVRTALSMLWGGSSLGDIRRATRLDGPGIVREYTALLARVRRGEQTHKRAG